MKILLVGAKLFHAGPTDGRTDGYDVANNRFRSYANAPKKMCQLYIFMSGAWSGVVVKALRY